MDKATKNQPTTSMKPKRSDYTKTIVVDTKNSSVLEVADWRAIVGDKAEGRELTKAFKKHGLQTMRAFNREEYEKAKVSFYSTVHAETKGTHETLIENAFKEADLPRVKRLESALRSLIPIFKKQTPAKTVQAFRNILKAVAASGVVKELQDREARKTAPAKSNKRQARQVIDDAGTPALLQ